MSPIRRRGSTRIKSFDIEHATPVRRLNLQFDFVHHTAQAENGKPFNIGPTQEEIAEAMCHIHPGASYKEISQYIAQKRSTHVSPESIKATVYRLRQKIKRTREQR